jgi:hypothetical protein
LRALTILLWSFACFPIVLYFFVCISRFALVSCIFPVVFYLFACINHFALVSCIFCCCFLSFCMHQPFRFGLLCFF